MSDTVRIYAQHTALAGSVCNEDLREDSDDVITWDRSDVETLRNIATRPCRNSNDLFRVKMAKSALEYFAESNSEATGSNKRLAAMLRSAASALEHGRHTTAKKKKLAAIVESQSEREAALTAELAALHDLQSACQVALRDVPHQKHCQFVRDPRFCTCVRKLVADLEKLLADQLG